MFMAMEEIEQNLECLKVNDEVVVIRDSVTKIGCVDYMEGKVKSIKDDALIIMFEMETDKEVLKNSIRSLKIR